MNPSEKRSRMLFALRRLLRPIARLLIGAGIRFDEFAELARGVYVENAIRRGASQAVLPTRERIAMVTGLTGRQIGYYIDNEGALPMADPTLSALLVEALQKWHTIPPYSGPYGIPLELEFDTPTDRCFRSLVALVDPAADPRWVLQELLRTGAAALSGEKHVRAVSRSLTVDPTSPQLIEHFGMTLSRLAATLEYNMSSEHVEKRLERCVMADRGLPLGLVPEFEAYVRERAADLLVDLDNWLAPYASDELNPAERIDVGVNVFLYAEPPLLEEPLSLNVDTGSSQDKNYF